MEKRDLINEIDKILKPLGFKRKGNLWKYETIDLVKIIELQKSRFGNQFYINFGYNLKNINDEDLYMHIFLGLSSNDQDENQIIKDILDLENKIEKENRLKHLTFFIQKFILSDMKAIKEEKDLLLFIKRLPSTNMLPGIVKDYFNL